MAACYIRQRKWQKAVYAASKTLALAPENLKALYRRAEANLELGKNQVAAKDIDLALDLRPEGESPCHTTVVFGIWSNIDSMMLLA